MKLKILQVCSLDQGLPQVLCNGQSVPKVAGISEHILFARYVIRLISCLMFLLYSFVPFFI